MERRKWHTWAYASDKVEPWSLVRSMSEVDIYELTQEPPKTCHLSILRSSLSFSMSLTRSQVVFSSRDALLHIVVNWRGIGERKK